MLIKMIKKIFIASNFRVEFPENLNGLKFFFSSDYVYVFNDFSSLNCRFKHDSQLKGTETRALVA